MKNPSRFYESADNAAMPSISDSEEDILLGDFDSYCPFHSSTSELYESNSDEASLGGPSSDNDDI